MNLFRFSDAFSNQSFIYDIRMITIIAIQIHFRLWSLLCVCVYACIALLCQRFVSRYTQHIQNILLYVCTVYSIKFMAFHDNTMSKNNKFNNIIYGF